jgi:tetratricopeptide (TPR) repeat protein
MDGRQFSCCPFFMAKIACGIIIKDDKELPILQRCIKSIIKHVDAIYITGTNQPCTEIQKYCKKIGAEYSFFQWVNDFSKARNFNLQQIPKEYDWFLWLDTDDQVQGAETFQDAIKIAEANNCKAIFARYLYQVELDEKGRIKNILIEHLRERLIRNDGSCEWVAPVHETLIEKIPIGKTDYQGFVVVHMIDGKQMENSMWRNISILEQNCMDNPQDPRPIYYLAKAYFDTRQDEVLKEPIGQGMESLTLELLKAYRAMSGWAEERGQSWEYTSMIYREQGRFKEAISALHEALQEDPKFTSIYIQLALCYVLMKDWSKAFHWVKLAGQIDIPKTTLVINPKDYKVMILEALFHIYLNTGKLDECFKVATDLNIMLPNDLNSRRVIDITDLRNRNNLAHYIVKLAHHLNNTNQSEQLENLVQSIPQEIANEPAMVDLRNKFTKARKWEDDEIAIYCGQGWEQWSWKSGSKGIGGSEEAVIYMSKELAKLGWKVYVYADPQQDTGVHDGVAWLPYYHINWRDEFNILIGWRNIALFDIPNLKAKRSYLWSHDIQNNLTYTPERVNKITKAMFLSKWHRDNVPSLDESKVMITANGI